MSRWSPAPDLDSSKAKEAAEKFSIPKVLSVEQLIADPSIEIVLNLTVPKAHVPISLAALEAGKHTYLEKPLGIDRTDGKKVIDLAKKKNLRVGCAPDTFMGAGVQTARKLIDDGAIGRPVAFSANFQCRGHESWHASPEFYYQVGGGPMFDMGPYYLTALLNLLGPVKRVSGMATIAIADRTITSQPLHGKKILVETPDHIVGVMEFENGAVGTITTSFAMLERAYDDPASDHYQRHGRGDSCSGSESIRRNGEIAEGGGERSGRSSAGFCHRIWEVGGLGGYGGGAAERTGASGWWGAGVLRVGFDARFFGFFGEREVAGTGDEISAAGGDAGGFAVWAA